jgi:Na+/H+ antiporter NhaD/arsenite permease-like protein
MQWNRRQGLTLILFGLTILAVITNIIDNTLSALVGVALMGQAKGKYTFFSHLKWTPAIALGYAASIAVHFAFNGALFHP